MIPHFFHTIAASTNFELPTDRIVESQSTFFGFDKSEACKYTVNHERKHALPKNNIFIGF